MRLIDADAKVTVQSFDPMTEEYYHKEMSVEQALDFGTDKGCPPTIDAIPVEWLCQKMRQEDESEHFLKAEYIKELIWEYHQEQEVE